MRPVFPGSTAGGRMQGGSAERDRTEKPVVTSGLFHRSCVVLLLALVCCSWSRPAFAGLWVRDSLALRVADDGRVLYRLYRALKQARSKEGPGRRAALRGVLEQVRAALSLHQDRAVLWYLLGLVLESLDEPGAVAALLESRRRGARGALGEGISFHLALLYVKKHRCDRALEEYRRTASSLSSPRDRALVATNAAECEMTLGRLGRALDGYRRALRLDPSSRGAKWGLAVALHRQGRTRTALTLAQAALAGDPKLDALVGPGVFFVPAVEVEYYLALAALAGGDEKGAVSHWKRYLDAFPKSLWRVPAQRSLLRMGVRPRGHRVLVQFPSNRRRAGRVFQMLRRSVSAAVMRCLGKRDVDSMTEMRLRLELVVERGGRIRLLSTWPLGPWMSCLGHVLARRKLPSSGVGAGKVQLRAWFLLDWGGGSGTSSIEPVEGVRGHPGRLDGPRH